MKLLDPIVLEPARWQAMAAEHEARVAPWIEPHLARSFRSEPHPVYDFLFTYYSFKPGQLRRWHPGLGFAFSGDGSENYLTHAGYEQSHSGVTASPSTLKPARREGFAWMLGMLEATAARPARFGCYGLHEWAMVYRAQGIRHERYPLRLSPRDIESTVESQPLCCTHYDAFRFFTPEARPLNRHQPERSTTAEFEQRGCLHANMDLYKWAYKLVPFTSSSLVADCFDLARDIREVDMRASPYDLSALGFTPIPVEIPSGREEYETLQRDFASRSVPLRARLISVLSEVVHTL